MLKKIFISFLILTLQSFSLTAFSKTVKVMALNSFSSQNPPKYFKVQLMEPFYIKQDNLTLEEKFILDGYIESVIPPKRLKQDATFIYVPTKYTDNNNIAHSISDIIGTHSTKINKTDLVVSSALILTMGVVPALLAVTGIFAAEGAIKDTDGNRLKSSADNAYNKSFLSLGKKGDELYIEKYEKFLLNIVIIKSQEPNYSYSPAK